MIKNYYKPTSKKWLKISLAIRSMIATIATAAYLQNMPNVTFWLFVAGSAADFLINIFSDGSEEGRKKKTPSYVKQVLPLLIIAIMITGCTTTKKTSESSVETTKLDSNWKTKTQVPVTVPGSQTPTVNMDDIKKSLAGMYVPASNGNGMVPSPQIINKTFYVPDSSGKMFMKYWVDSMGNLMAQCESKDQVIMALVDQNNRLIREITKESTWEKVVKYKWPAWLKWLMVGAGVFLVYKIVMYFIKKG